MEQTKIFVTKLVQNLILRKRFHKKNRTNEI